MLVLVTEAEIAGLLTCIFFVIGATIQPLMGSHGLAGLTLDPVEALQSRLSKIDHTQVLLSGLGSGEGRTSGYILTQGLHYLGTPNFQRLNNID